MEKEKWQTTNEIYADFDSYMHTKCVSVASFADIMTANISDSPTQQTPMTNQGNKRSYDKMVEEGCKTEIDNSTQSSDVIINKKRDGHGILSLTKNRRKDKVRQPKRMKIDGSKVTANQQTNDRPDVSFPYMITMALRSSVTGWLPVEEIYNYIRLHYAYYRTAPNNWRNSVRHALSTGRMFIKQELSRSSKQRRFQFSVNPKKNAKNV